MNSLTEPANHTRTGSDTNTVSEWLDALSTGACDEATFLEGVGLLLQRAPDAGWELLALVDQYYRRGKINAATFGRVKAHLQTLLMGNGRRGEVSVPLLRPAGAGTAPGAERPRATPIHPLPDAASVPLHWNAADLPPPAVEVSLPVTGRVRSAAPASAVTQEQFNASTAAAPESEPARPERVVAPGDVLRGRYRVRAVLGHGGMGTVFEAVDEYRLDGARGDQRVAIKVLHTAVMQRPRLFAELRREFQHQQSLSHPNIARVHEFDRDGDLAFFTMEYLSGMPLSRILSLHTSSPLRRADALAIVRDVGAAIAHAHSRGVVHGDLNPNNVFVTEEGDLRVLDFGASSPLRRGPWISEFENNRQITVATPAFASCQQLEGETPDARDDVYALACLMYSLVAGAHPFGGRSALEARSLRLRPRRPSGISREQWSVVRTGLHFERDRRPPNIQAWLEKLNLTGASPHLPALAMLSAPPPARSGGMRWIAVGTLVALVAGGVGWVATHGTGVWDAKNELTAAFRARFANTVISQLWEDEPRRAVDPSSVLPPSSEDAPAPVASSAAAKSPSAAAGRSSATAPAVPTSTPPVARTTPAATPPAVISPIATSPIATPPIATRSVAPVATAAASRSVPPNAANAIHARLELAADNVDVTPEAAVAHVSVRRTRTLRGGVSFSWWTESGTAKPGRDFTPVKSQVQQVGDGESTVDLSIPVVANPARRESRSFYVVIDEASDNAFLGKRTLTMVTLSGAE